MRLIDADALRAEFTDNFSFEYWHYTGILEMIDVRPTINAVEVVRCKDCRHWAEGHCLRSHGGGSYVPFPMDSYDFCSYGERRNDV